MAAQKKQISICSYETGTLVFATFNLIFALSLCVLAVVENEILDGFFKFFQFFGGLIIPLALLAFNWLFSVLLFLGSLIEDVTYWLLLLFEWDLPFAQHNTSELIKAYFWYGVIMVFISGFVMLYAVILSITIERSLTAWSAGMIAFYTLYAQILNMIYKTSQKLARAENGEDNRELFLDESENEKAFMPYYFRA